MDESLAGLLAAQRGLSERFADFRGALDRRDEAAYRMAFADFQACLKRWTEAQERGLLPALRRTGVAGRDPQRELHLEWVQVRELARYLLAQLGERAPLADILGLVENLGRRLAAHEAEVSNVYYPAAIPTLTAEEWAVLAAAVPPR